MDEEQAHRLHQQLKSGAPSGGKGGLGYSAPKSAPPPPAGAPPPVGAPHAGPPQPYPGGRPGMMPRGPPGMPPWGFAPPPGLPPPGYFRPPPGMPPPYGMPPPFPYGMPPRGPFPGGPPPGMPPPGAPPLRPAPPPPAAASGGGAPGGGSGAAASKRKEEEERAKRAGEAWSAYKSDDGSVYYYNQITGESTWERPEGFKGDADKASSNPVPLASERVPGTEWLEVTCDDGKKYFHNPKTDETTWHVPPEVERQLKLKLDPQKAKMLERARAMGATVAPEFEQGGAGGAGSAAADDDEDVTFTEDDLGLVAQPDSAPAAAAAAAAPPAGASPEAAAAGPAAIGAADAAEGSAERKAAAAPWAAGTAAPEGQAAAVPGQGAAPPALQPPPQQQPSAPPGMPPPGHYSPGMPPQGYRPTGHYPPGAPHPYQQPRPWGVPPHPGMRPPGMPPPGAPPPGLRPPPGVLAAAPPPRAGMPPGPGQLAARAPPQQQQQPQQAPAKPAKPQTGYGPDGHMPKEEAIAAFKALLAEKGVHAFSRYERELPKLQPDKRFKYIPTVAERKQTFEAYCSESTAAKKAGGAKGATAAGASAAKPAGGAPAPPAPPSRAAADFERLLDEVERALGSDGGAAAAGGEEGQLLAWDESLTLEQLEPRWGSDPRWEACPADARAAALEARLAPLRAATRKRREADYRALLRERGVGAGARWSRTKEDLAGDPRYRALPRDDRESLFRAYVAELAKAEEQQAEREAKQRQLERRAEAERRAADARRQQAAHTDAVTHFKALLQELHLGPDARWRDYADRVKRDAQGRGTNPALERGEAESMFRDFVHELWEGALEAYLDLLDAEIKPLIPTHEQQQSYGLPKPLVRWHDAEPLLEDDERFGRLSPADRERVWRRYVDDEMFNRDHPLMRPRTQRKQQRDGGEDAAGGPGGPGSAAGQRRARPLTLPTDNGALDKAYQREYIAVDAKRLRRE